jgi:hypothetical protein
MRECGQGARRDSGEEGASGRSEGNAGRITYRGLVVAVGSALSMGLTVAGAQFRYEAPAVLRAGDVVPPDLLQNPIYQVDERVTTDGLLTKCAAPPGRPARIPLDCP